MKMVIRPYLLAVNSASNHPVGTEIPFQLVVYRESGWESVIEFQKDRLRHHLGHPTEMAVPMKNGIKVMERGSQYGLKRIMEVTLEGDDHA